MQNLGLLFSLDPWLRRAYPKKTEYREAALRHLEYFNTNPYMAGFVCGVLGGMEEQAARAPEEERPAQFERIGQVKKALGSGLAAVGDSLFWGAIRPALAAWTLLLWSLLRKFGAPHPTAAGAVFFLAAYNSAAMAVRWKGLRLGYQHGEQLPLRLKEYRWQDKARWIRWTGLAAAAAVAVLEIHAASAKGHRNGLAGFLIIAGGVVLKRLGVSTVKIYAAIAAAGGLVSLARAL